MVSVTLSELDRVTYGLLHASGLNEENAAVVTDVFMRATLRGVGHHDIYDLPGRISGLAAGKIHANPSIRMLHKYGCMENYEGDNGLGEVCGMFVMKRAEQLAEEHGIGLCAVRNTNHILASAPYVEVAAEDGYIGYIATRGAPTMGAPGRKEKVIGTSPMGYAIPTDKGYPIMFDACLAYASNGLLHDKIRAGETVPSYWGLDADGRPTGDPAAISKGTRMPIAGHKGFGLAILGEVITGILAEGQIIDELQPGTGMVGQPSHTAICIKADGILGSGELKRRAAELADRMGSRASDLRIPGQQSYLNKSRILAAGTIELKEELAAKINDWAKKLDVAPI